MPFPLFGLHASVHSENRAAVAAEIPVGSPRGVRDPDAAQCKLKWTVYRCEDSHCPRETANGRLLSAVR